MIYSLLLQSEDILSFSAVTDFAERLSGTVSVFETEFGFPINDNVTLNNAKFSISAVMSYYNTRGREAVYEGGKWTVRDDSGNAVMTHAELEDSVRDIFINKEPFSILVSEDMNDLVGTQVNEVRGCVIENLTFNQTASKFGAVFPNMDIVKTTQTVVVVEDIPDVKPQLIPIQKVGTKEELAKATEEATTNQPNIKSSDPTAQSKSYQNDPEAVKIDQDQKNRIASLEAEKNARQRAVDMNKDLSRAGGDTAVKPIPDGRGGWTVDLGNAAKHSAPLTATQPVPPR